MVPGPTGRSLYPHAALWLPCMQGTSILTSNSDDQMLYTKLGADIKPMLQHTQVLKRFTHTLRRTDNETRHQNVLILLVDQKIYGYHCIRPHTTDALQTRNLAITNRWHISSNAAQLQEKMHSKRSVISEITLTTNQSTTQHFLLATCINNVPILHCFRNITTSLLNKKGSLVLTTPALGVIYHPYASTWHVQNLHRI